MTSETPSGGGIWWVIVALLLATPILYALSLGPAVYVVDRTGWGGGPMMRTFFKPVTWLRERPLLREPYDEYVEWWLQR